MTATNYFIHMHAVLLPPLTGTPNSTVDFEPSAGKSIKFAWRGVYDAAWFRVYPDHLWILKKADDK